MRQHWCMVRGEGVGGAGLWKAVLFRKVKLMDL